MVNFITMLNVDDAPGAYGSTLTLRSCGCA